MERMNLSDWEVNAIRTYLDDKMSKIIKTEHAVAYYEALHLNPKSIKIDRFQYDMYQKIVDSYDNEGLTVEDYIRSVLWRHLHENKNVLAIIKQRVDNESAEEQNKDS